MTCPRGTSGLMKMALLWFVFTCLMGMTVEPASAATLVVNSLDDTDDGLCGPVHCSLREAIKAANGSPGADTILFTGSGTITLGSDLPWILSAGGALTIDGTGWNITVSGAGAYRPFFIDTEANLTLVKLTVRNGYGISGGGIYNRGTVTLQNCLLSTNRARDYGGGIFTQGPLVLSNTGLSSNTVDLYDGGGLYIDSGEVQITGGIFSYNEALCRGGAIHNNYTGEYQKGRLFVEGANFFLNNANSCGGGAIYSDSDMEIRQSSFSLNSAEDNGGAVYVRSVASPRIYTSTFYANNVLLEAAGPSISEMLTVKLRSCATAPLSRTRPAPGEALSMYSGD